MTDTPYNMPPLGLFGKRCRILTGYDKRPFVYRIVNSEWMSNTWCEPPITYQSERNPVRHDHSENVLIVVLDTLIDENSRLIRVALKDVELMDETPDNADWISVKDGLPDPMKDKSVLSGWSEEIKPSDAVLCYIESSKRQTVAWYSYACHEWTDVEENTVYTCDDITHWMPLPEPPKEEEHESLERNRP